MAIGDMTLREFLQIQTFGDPKVRAPLGFDSRIEHYIYEAGEYHLYDPLEYTVTDLVNTKLPGTFKIPYAMVSSNVKSMDDDDITFETNPVGENDDLYRVKIWFSSVPVSGTEFRYLYELQDGYVQMGVKFEILQGGS